MIRLYEFLVKLFEVLLLHNVLMYKYVCVCLWLCICSYLMGPRWLMRSFDLAAVFTLLWLYDTHHNNDITTKWIGIGIVRNCRCPARNRAAAFHLHCSLLDVIFFPFRLFIYFAYFQFLWRRHIAGILFVFSHTRTPSLSLPLTPWLVYDASNSLIIRWAHVCPRAWRHFKGTTPTHCHYATWFMDPRSL